MDANRVTQCQAKPSRNCIMPHGDINPGTHPANDLRTCDLNRRKTGLS